jgi:hypothetical protein
MNSRRRIGHPYDGLYKPIAVGASCLAGLPIFFAAREAAPGRVAKVVGGHRRIVNGDAVRLFTRCGYD